MSDSATLRRASTDAERGSGAVEFAISAIVLMTLILGSMTAALAFYSWGVINNYAREGSRYAIVHGSGCSYLVSGTATSCYIGANNANGTNTKLQTYVRNLGFPAISPASVDVSPTFTMAPGASACISAGCHGAGDQVTVTVTYPFLYAIPFVRSRSFTMNATSTMIISQ